MMERMDGEITNRRVQFDFEISFSNGGGLQGQDFRLDIDGNDVGDFELAALIVKELQLLMVGEVRILNKKVIRERHKHSISVASATSTETAIQFVDLSHTIVDGLITYKGLPAPVICDFMSREASKAHYAEGTTFQIGRLEMVSNTGTYLDSPFHRFSDGIDVSELDLPQLADLDACVVRVTGSEARAIDYLAFAGTEVQGKAVLVHTDWAKHWATDHYFEGHPFLTASAAEYLRDQGAVLVGIDSLNIDDTEVLTRPVHTTLLKSGILIVEHLCNLENLPVSGFTFSAVPVKVKGMGTFPVRAFAKL
jgi:arylformamidase